MSKHNKSMKFYLNCIGFLVAVPMLAFAYSGQEAAQDTPYNNWLKEEFAAQHEQLIPVVAVADMYYSCNESRKVHHEKYTVRDLVLTVKRDELANKLQSCLGKDTVKSDVAVNFGLTTCFKEQLAHLPVDEQKEKMQLVQQAILSLSREERHQSFTQCVTDQAISYLK